MLTETVECQPSGGRRTGAHHDRPGRATVGV